jgi:GT2 family glycosyltransferase
MKLSIVIGTLGSPHLARIVGTFLASRRDLEIVVVIDDPAVSPAVLLPPAMAADPRVIMRVNERNVGITRSLNRAIAIASGDVIVRADDDDLPDASRLDEVVTYLEANPTVDLVYSYARGVDETSGRSWLIKGPIENVAIQHQVQKRNFIVHSTLAFRRPSAERIGFYDETFRYAQDYDFYLRAIRAGLVFGGIPRVLVTRLYHEGSITVARRKRQILHSMAARLLHAAQGGAGTTPWGVLARYGLLLAVPQWARTARRKLGCGR